MKDPMKEKRNRKVVVVPPRPDPEEPVVYKCGVCGVEFESGEVYGYSCAESRCPMMSPVRYAGRIK